ncbi:MAG: polymerase subunit beta [Candidatus Peribacteria bacterium]|nr:polymerase subunit beta [Candidatus Peribacteria bacterium]
MKFSCNTSDFLQGLHTVSRAIGGAQALPILGNVLLEVENGKCTLSATDLEVSIITQFPANIESEGRITIPAKAMMNFVQYNSDTEVTMELKDGSQLHCSSKRAKAVLSGESANEYPNIADIERQTVFQLKAEPLSRALHLVTFASAKTSLRPVLSGVSIRSLEGKLILVATDSYRLSEYKLPAEGVGELSCIVPAKILEEVKVILSGAKAEKSASKEIEAKEVMVDIALSRQQIEFTIGSTRLLSRLIEGKFPDYNQIIPKETTTKVVFTLKELMTSVRRMHYFAKEMNNKLTFNCKPEETTIATPQTQIGKDETTLACELTGEENKIALSSSYLLDLLGHVDGEVLLMKMVDSQHPALFYLPDEEQFLHLVMPLRMTES